MKLGFLGFGNLAKALSAGLISAGAVKAGDISVYVKTAETAEYAVSLGHTAAGSIKELISGCDIFVIAVKPKVFLSLAEEIEAACGEGKETVSVMACVSVADISRVTHGSVLRVIPTLAVSGGGDVIGVSGIGAEGVKTALSKLGTVIECDEGKLDALTVAASCGLGFAAHIEALYAREIEKLGFSGEEARLITSASFGNAASSGDFKALAERVATKGGLTERGIKSMDEKGLADILNGTFSDAFSVVKH